MNVEKEETKTSGTQKRRKISGKRNIEKEDGREEEREKEEKEEEEEREGREPLSKTMKLQLQDEKHVTFAESVYLSPSPSPPQRQDKMAELPPPFSSREGGGVDVAVLLETTMYNCNILHLCCGKEEESRKQTTPSHGTYIYTWFIHVYTFICTCTYIQYVF